MTSMQGRIDIHSHLLPGVDDGCVDTTQSVACAKRLVEAGYTHAFCTPHIWPHLPHNNVRDIPQRVGWLQAELDKAGVPLTLMPGGELNLRPQMLGTPRQEIPSYRMAGRYVLFDLWADALPEFFWPVVRYLQDQRFTVIMAHPERMAAVQREPEIVDELQENGLLLQGNLQCFSDPEDRMTRILVERFLKQGRYWALGSDTHNPQTIACRMDGLKRVIELLPEDEVRRLTVERPSELMAP